VGRIRILPDAIANQIAAGEVVERPASVVKELLENSLDAGAGEIRVDAEAGGRRLIRVADDGSGMLRDDALLAFERHATSKLREARDLFAIATLGFRGEALPSIASVSRLELETRAAEETTGTRIEIAGAKILKCDPFARPPGTTITVRDLFYNVPARRKFLRSEQTELAHLASLVTHYSSFRFSEAKSWRTWPRFATASTKASVSLVSSPARACRSRTGTRFTCSSTAA
jgi:DNA mismatch repair protein MutL